MHDTRTRRLRASPLISLLAMVTLGLAGCGGSDEPAPAGGGAGPTAQISGVAAVGAPIAGATVTGTNARGQTVTTVTGNDGSYRLEIDQAAPYALRVTDAAGQTWYSYAPSAGRANLTPLTTLAMADVWGYKPLADMVTAWQANAPTAEQVLAAAAKVNANLQASMRAQGLDPAALNIFSASFAANGQGLDAVLDAIRVHFDCSATACSQHITSPDGAVLVNWNAAISTVGFSVSWDGGSTGGGGQVDVNLGACSTSPVAGTWSLVVQTTISGFGALPVPEVCIDGLAGKPASEGEFCAGSDVLGALPAGVQVLGCSFDGSVGQIAARISAPVTIDYSVKYIFVQR